MPSRSRHKLARRTSLCLPFQLSSSSSLQSTSYSVIPMSSSSSNIYIRGRGSFTGGSPSHPRKPPHVILPITPTPPPLPPPPPNPQLTPLKPRSHSQQWSSSKAFGIGDLDHLPGKPFVFPRMRPIMSS